MYRTLMGLGLVAVFAVVTAMATADNAQTKNDEASAQQELRQALEAFQNERSEENLTALEEAASSYKRNHPDGQLYANAVIIWLQVKELQEDWEPIVEYANENLDDKEGELRVQVLSHAGTAHANLGNEEEAREIVDELRQVRDGRAGQFAQRSVRQIESALMYANPGAESPEFTLPTVDGEEEVSLEDLEGSYVVLDFWATWCTPCAQVANNHLMPLWERYQDEDFEIVGVGTPRNDTAEAQRQMAEEQGWDWTKVHDTDGEVTQAYNVTAYPFLVLIDPEGKIVGGAAGARLMETIEERLSEAFGDAEEEEAEEEDGDWID